MPYKHNCDHNASQRALRVARRARGVCTRCQGPRDDSRYMDCSVCLKRSNGVVKQIVKRNKRLGLCGCGQKRLRGKRCCQRCADHSKNRLRNLKLQVIAGYGGECACCEIRIYEFLSVDHVKERGADERRRLGKNATSSGSLYRKIIRENFPDTYRILCYNCNMSLGFFGYCPHHPRIKRSIKKRRIQ